MNRLLLVIAALFGALALSAQDMPVEHLNKRQARYLEGALAFRDAMADCNPLLLEIADSILDERPTSPNRLELEDLELDVIDGDGLASLEGHPMFTQGCVRHWRQTCDASGYRDSAVGMRAINFSECCLIAHYAIKGGSSVTLKGPDWTDAVNIFTVAEPGIDIALSVTTADGTQVPVAAYEDGAVQYGYLPLPGPTDLTITLTNRSDSDGSLVIVSD